MSVNEKMTAIADAIRSKTGGTEALSLDDMASGVNEVYDKGRNDEMSAFWDSALKKGVSSISFSGNVWNDETFQPTRNIWCQSGNNGNWFFSNNQITSVKKALAVHNVSFNTKNLHALTYAFRALITVDLPELDLSNIKKTAGFSEGLTGNNNLVTIDKIILTENWTSISSFGSFMQGNSKLENVIFEGVIPATISFSSCPLSIASLKSIITHLKDYSGTTSEYTYTVTFKTSAFEALETEGATAEYNGVACTWAELIGFLKWNLVKA